MDIVKRLQGISMMQAMTWVTADKSKRLANIYSEAADEIERLREALGRIAKHDLQAIALNALSPNARKPIGEKE